MDRVTQWEIVATGERLSERLRYRGLLVSTTADVALLAETDALHDTLSAPATQRT